jgi:hypothetical protein
LDTPVEEIEWMLRIHDVYQRAEQKQAQGNTPQLPNIPQIG